MQCHVMLCHGTYAYLNAYTHVCACDYVHDVYMLYHYK